MVLNCSRPSVETFRWRVFRFASLKEKDLWMAFLETATILIMQFDGTQMDLDSGGSLMVKREVVEW